MATDLAERYLAVRHQTESLAAGLSAEDQMLQSMSEASPVKWHLAHTTWFFETFVLLPHLPGYVAFHPEFTRLFNSYYNAVGDRPQRPHRGLMSRPPLEQVLRYRRHVDEFLLRLLDQDDPRRALVEVGLHHEQQHQELIVTDIKHAFWTQPLRPAYRERQPSPLSPAVPAAWMGFPGGLYSVGHDGPDFSFDNDW
jgi:ergothioneine biosynthesis protein EgtB